MSKPEPENLPSIINRNMDLDPNSILLGRILEAGVRFYARLWEADTEEEKGLIEGELKKFSESYRHKLASFALFFNRAVPSKSYLFHGKMGDRKAITPEQLEKAGLTEEQLKQIAGIED